MAVQSPDGAAKTPKPRPTLVKADAKRNPPLEPGKFGLIDLYPEEVAEQLTLIEQSTNSDDSFADHVQECSGAFAIRNY